MFDRIRLSRAFVTFAEKECKGSSRLYEFLATEIAEDDHLLQLCSNVQRGQPVPNLLFGAVHYLLLKGKEHPLREYYPSISQQPKPCTDSFLAFKEFCLTYQDDIAYMLNTRLVQTNEVRRCAYLYPVFCMVYEKTKKPLALVEIGTSAGLQLLWDKYAYTYGGEQVFGNKNAKLKIAAEIKGVNKPFLRVTPPPVTTRLGMDWNTVDLNRENEKLWLKALMWPEHKERLDQFKQAANEIKDYAPRLIKGDGVGLLAEKVQKVPLDSIICVFHTHVANQMPQHVKDKLLRTVKDIGGKRDIFHIYNNIQDKYLHLDYYLDGTAFQHTVAATDGHGRWFSWFLQGGL